MNKIKLTVLTISLFFLVSAGINAADVSSFDELTVLRDSAFLLEANIFAPRSWKKADELYLKAKSAINRGKKQKDINKYTAQSREYTDNAIRASEVAHLSLSEYLDKRERAKKAKAQSLAPQLYAKAEKQFVKATGKVEKGDVKSGLKEAEKSLALFDIAEMRAIRIDILGNADKLIATAIADDAGKYALSTLDKARSALTKGNAVLTRDRYEREESIREAKRAEYEARHASNIALSVRALNRNDQAWEKLMLLYEIQMNRVGKEYGLEYLRFDKGSLAAADTLIARYKKLKRENELYKSDSQSLLTSLNDELEKAAAVLGITDIDDPLSLARAFQGKIEMIIAEKDDLAEQLEESQTAFASLTEEHASMSEELTERRAKEEKFRKAKKILNPSEGEVLFNSSNDIVLRLSGFSFDIGKSDIKDEHIPLILKIQTIIEMFPNTKLVIEGHTDASGDGASNMLLSEKRAFAVMQLLRQGLLIPVSRITSIGYGADRPVASNQTKDGRSKNRRIDIIIMQ